MSLRMKAEISCDHWDRGSGEGCSATAEVLVGLSEQQGESGCDCCSRGTGLFLIDPPADNSLPEGWKRGWYSKDRFFCPKHDDPR